VGVEPLNLTANHTKKNCKIDVSEGILQVGVEPTTFALLPMKDHINQLPGEYKNDTLTTLFNMLAFDFYHRQ